MKIKLGKLYNYLESNLIVLVAALAVFVSPFVVDYSNLPKGYELPKVHFLLAVSVVIILLGVIKYLELAFKKKKIIFNKDFAVFLSLVLFFVISSLVSPHLQVSVYGNSFRDQGLLTHLSIIGMGYVLYKSVNRKNFHLLALAFIGSAIIQSALAYIQAVDLIQNDPTALLEGYWVNGTFGQANFFSGRLLMGLVFLAYYTGRSLKIKFEILIKLLFILSTLFIVGALLFSLSIWAILTAAVMFVIIVLYEMLPKKVFKYIFLGLTILALIFGAYYIYSSTIYNIRIDIWKNILNIMFVNPNLKNTLFGYGFDTLGYVFKDVGAFPGNLIDRAHNFFFDILIQAGVAGLAVSLGIILKPFIAFSSKIGSRKFAFAFFALFFWLLRSFVHESGIVNMVDFLVVLAMALALSKDSKEVSVELNIDLEKLEIPEIATPADEALKPAL